MKTFFRIVGFLAIDLLSKEVAEIYFSKWVIYNKNLSLGLDLGWFAKFVLPLLIIWIPLYFFRMVENQDKRSFLTSLFIGGAIGNYIGRFSGQGVVDFINFGYCVANLADLMIFLAYALFLYESVKTDSKMAQKVA